MDTMHILRVINPLMFAALAIAAVHSDPGRWHAFSAVILILLFEAVGGYFRTNWAKRVRRWELVNQAFRVVGLAVLTVILLSGENTTVPLWMSMLMVSAMISSGILCCACWQALFAQKQVAEAAQ